MFDSILKPQAFSDIACNARLKTYPDGTQELLVCDRPIFGLDGWEELDGERCSADEPKRKSKAKKQKANQSSIERSKRRARVQVKDISLCSDFSYFVTLTLDKKKIDRYDISEIVKRLRIWLDNRVRRNGLRYLLVPERHKDGAIHFHGFFNDALAIVDSGRVDKRGHTIYNLPSWDFGFTTAIKLYGDYAKAVAYVCKYIGKAQEKIGGRWYYSGGSLKRPKIDFFELDADFREPEGGIRFDIEEAKLSFVLYRHSP